MPRNKKTRVTWIINSNCNFDCPYCYTPKDKKIQLASKDNKDFESVIKFFNKNKFIEIYILGGEPFLHPKFIEICEKLTENNHQISISTNLSSPLVYEFADKIDPKKTINISASLQITELQRLNLKEDFIKKYLYLKNKGFNVSATLVIWPPILRDLKKIMQEWDEKGVSIKPLLFYGTFQEKSYPKSYTKKELELIYSYSSKNLNDFYPNLNRRDITFKGIPCLAGKNFIRVDSAGEVTRCDGERISLGNIYRNNVKLFEKAMPCNSEICNCLWQGYLFAEGNPKKINKNFSEKIKFIKEKINCLKNNI